uniref:Uncharacterized protein n=1 Tax=Cucumis melo TaxID=3656 RepID=A0A9I9D1W9_CUCME
MIKKYLIVVQRWASKGAGERHSASRGAALDEEGSGVRRLDGSNSGIRQSFGRRSTGVRQSLGK